MFDRLANELGRSDKSLRLAVGEVERGLIDASLGGNLIKKRIAVGNRGKSGGLRTILVYKTNEDRIFCIYVFAKNERDNIARTELEQLKLLAKTLRELDESELSKSLETGALVEVLNYDESAD